MTPSIARFVTSDGYEHIYRHWRPEAERPKGYLVALHGIQSHSGWYEHSSRKLCEAGWEVMFVDRRGSGLNQKERGHARHADRLVNDVLQFLSEVRHRRNAVAPTVPVALLGLSWGGKLAAVAASIKPELVDGLILQYPGICPRIRMNPWQHFQLSLAKAVEVFDKRVPVPLDDPALFTASSEAQRFIREDNLALHDVSVSFLLANRKLDRLAAKCNRSIRCPVLLMLSGRDRIIDNVAVKEWAARLATPERRVIEYPEASHTLEFEPDRDRMISDLTGWLDSLCLTT